MTEAMSRSRRFALASSVVAAVLAIAACDGSAPKPPAGAPAGAAAPGGGAGPGAGPGAAGGAPPALPVTVAEVRPRKVPVVLDAVARTEGSREVEVRARVAGILERQLFREGELVRAGAPMYRIDRAPFEISLAQTRAALAEAQARAARSQLEAERLQKLLAERAISQREYDDAQASRLQTQATLQAAQARVHEAELNLSYTAVNAPISGVSGRTLRSEGSLVSPGSESALLTTLTQTDPIWVRFSLSDAEYAQLRGAGAKAATVRLALADGRTYERAGRLNFTGSTVDLRLGTVQLRAEFANPGLVLLPGQYVKARVEIGARDAVALPQTAVVQNDRGRFVWIVDASNKVSLRPVEVGGWDGSDWIVEKGLQAGDRVALDNLIRLRPNATIQPRAPGAGPAGRAPGGAPGAGPASAR